MRSVLFVFTSAT